MSDTPRTDKHSTEDYYLSGTVPEDFAQELERENAEMLEALREALVHLDWDTEEPRERKAIDNIRAILARIDGDKP